MNEHTTRAFKTAETFNEKALSERDRIALAQVYATIGLAEEMIKSRSNGPWNCLCGRESGCRHEVVDTSP